MSSSSKKKGGWEKLKAAKEKEKREHTLLKSTPTLLTYYSKKQKEVSDTDSVELNTPEVIYQASTSHQSHEHQTESECQDQDAFCEGATASEKNTEDIEIDATTTVSEIPSCDPGKWNIYTRDERFISYWCEKGPEQCQNWNSDFSATKREYLKQNRYLTIAMFDYEKPNNEIGKREWLLYSPSTYKVYCFYCCLFNDKKSGQFCTGFNDWKNPVYISQHAKSTQHITAVGVFHSRRNISERIDAQLESQFLETRDYWQNVLKRVIETIVFISERGLAFRGSDEKVGSKDNGNYLGILELIARFDPFLSQHIQKHANQGKGHTSYLSKTISDELIILLAEKTLDIIIDEVKAAKYYSVCVDSTPDISHVDQLTVILRYVLPKGPVERFVTFISISSHTGEQLASYLTDFLAKHEVDIRLCRGQSYDNASNMSGKYSGMQAHIKMKNRLADYIPCAAHSLNLVGQSAVDCCVEAVSFFGLTQELYNFFSASTHRWKILTDSLEKCCQVTKSLSQTRWSANAEAVYALCHSYENICTALGEIQDNEHEKADTRETARNLNNSLHLLETGILCEMWNDILQPFNKCSIELQSSHIDITTAVGLLKSLQTVIQTTRGNFDAYEQKGATKTNNHDYKSSESRKRKKKYDDATSAHFTDREAFRVKTFIPITDNLMQELSRRIAAYDTINEVFGIIGNFSTNMSASQIAEGVRCLCEKYPDDFKEDFSQEYIQFVTYVKECPLKRMSSETKYMWLFRIIIETKVAECFPNVETAFRLFLSLMVTNCSGERSFSVLKRVKNYLRSTMSQSRLSALSLLSIESEIVRSLNYDNIIHDFASTKARKQQF